MVMGTTPIYAGHAGESGLPSIMPHQLMGAMIILGLAIVVLVVFVALAILLLMKLHQRVQRLEQELGATKDRAAKSPRPR
jgi:uncharacterized membrane protein